MERHELNQSQQPEEMKLRAMRIQRAGRKHYLLKSSFAVKAESGETIMILDIPIRGLNNQVALDTASAVKEFFEMCQAADPDSGYVAMHPSLQEKVVSVGKSMGLVAKSQRTLIEGLEKVSETQITSAGFQKVIADLERVVSQVDSAISDTYSAPEAMVKLWQRNLELVAQQNGHIDNYVESFRIAFDETCSALLADLATKVSGS